MSDNPQRFQVPRSIEYLFSRKDLCSQALRLKKVNLAQYSSAVGFGVFLRAYHMGLSPCVFVQVPSQFKQDMSSPQLQRILDCSQAVTRYISRIMSRMRVFLLPPIHRTKPSFTVTGFRAASYLTLILCFPTAGYKQLIILSVFVAALKVSITVFACTAINRHAWMPTSNNGKVCYKVIHLRPSTFY